MQLRKFYSYAKNIYTFILVEKFRRVSYALRLKIETSLFNLRRKQKKPADKKKYLYASPVGEKEKKYLEKTIRLFGHDDFDYLIFVYDNAKFSEPVYERCSFVYDKNYKWYYGKKYLTPDYCKKYEYIFFWDGDIDVQDFSYKNFVLIMDRNNLELAQPSLAKNSNYTHKITLRNEKYRAGRYVDFVEIMAPVFRSDAWVGFWNMLERDYNYWGFGYDDLARSFCGYHNMGIVDQESVRHPNPFRQDALRTEDMSTFLNKHRKCKIAMRISYAALK